ncbi:MAG: 23S rRNA (uracil(1939)-C(5))-methyltransferase RlmD [Clostridiales bacterium]|nr:23S rRNA (uracil(1939)-C(5))-methyltransferase RlmD [Clostridiales bacterium]
MSSTSILKSNPDACPLAKKCGGCQLQNMTYPRQLKWKQARAEILLKKFGRVDKITGMENPVHYRNKVQAAFGTTKGGKVISGVYQSGTHRIVNVDSCMTEDETADKIIVDIRNLLPKMKIPVYNEDRHTGFLRHVLVKRAFATDEVMVVLVAASPVFPAKKYFVKEITSLHPEIETIVLSINADDTSLVLGDREEILFGNGYITDVLCGLSFRISPKSFYQINPVQTEKLYNKAMELADLHKNSTVIDAYCGTGTIALVAAKTAEKVIGVELNPAAVRDARVNAKINAITSARFYCDDAGDFMSEIADEGEKVDVVFMDPPRSGSSRKFLSSLIKLKPERVIYISCNPETLARDLNILTKCYSVKAICPVDMFPHTNHVETVVLLVRYMSTDNHVTFEVKPDELDLGNLNVSGTYEQIKSYVFDKYGLKVSTLYIAQVKKKCGLDVGQAYMKPKNPDSRVPQCPPEKEKAIKNALIHFGMI